MDSAIAAPRPQNSNRKALYMAVGLGLMAALLTIFYLRGLAPKSDEVAIPTLSVVVAAQDIPAGTKITEAMVTLKALPQTAVIQNAATAKTQVIGQTTRYPLAASQQFNNLQMITAGKTNALSFQIPQGLRGFTIPVSANNTPAALFAPGDFVDVIVVANIKEFEPPTGPAPSAAVTDFEQIDWVASTLLQNVQVLAIQQKYVDNGVPYDSTIRGEPMTNDNISYATLALTPEQAQLLWLAGREGKITLSLRPFQDESIVPLPITPNLGATSAFDNSIAR